MADEEKVDGRKRKHAINTKFSSLQNINRKTSLQDDSTQARVRSWTLPTKWGENEQITPDSITPGMNL